MTAVDVLEHIAPDLRFQFFADMLRVTSDRAVIVTPLATEENRAVEQTFLAHMQEAGLDPKQSFLNHQKLGLPTLHELVAIGRSLRLPFDVFPATHRSTLFQSLQDQVAALAVDKDEIGQSIARRIAASAQDMLMQTSVPPWGDAYRAGLVVKKHEPGRIIEDDRELFLAENEMMAYQAALRKAGWQSAWSETDVDWFSNYPLRGRTINIEGPEGSGKTTLVKRLVQDLECVGIYRGNTNGPMVSGSGYAIWSVTWVERRCWGSGTGRIFLFAMWQAAVAGSAFSLLGPCHVNISDRGLESVRMHHGLHCPDNRTIPFAMQKHPLAISPDLYDSFVG